MDIQKSLSSTELVQQELAKAKSMDDFFGKGGIFTRWFANTIEKMLEAGLTCPPRIGPKDKW